MTTLITAKVFKNGRSQAVRIPAAFRLDVEEVFVSQNEKGEIILTPKPQTLFDLINSFDSPDVSDIDLELPLREISARPDVEW